MKCCTRNTQRIINWVAKKISLETCCKTSPTPGNAYKD